MKLQRRSLLKGVLAAALGGALAGKVLAKDKPVLFNSGTMDTSGAKLVSWRNTGTEIASIDKDGNFSVAEGYNTERLVQTLKQIGLIQV